MPEEVTNTGRRRLIGASALSAAVGAAAGLAVGVSASSAATPPRPVVIDGRRRFANKVVLVTGATSGIGRAAALGFAREGAKVAFCGRRVELGQDLERDLKAGGAEAMFFKADVRDEAQVKAFVDQTLEAFGGLDVAFNNAGVTIEKPLHEYSSAEWDEVVNTNLRGVFLSMKYEIPAMLARGGGDILINGSNSVRAGAYAASKHALTGLMAAAVRDYADKGIRINTIIPGTTNTAFVQRAANMSDLPEAAWNLAAAQWGKANAVSGRMATAEEVAAFAVTLAAGEFPYMAGASLELDGGGSR